MFAVEEAFEQFAAGGPRLKDGSHGDGWRRGGKAGPCRIHDDGLLQAEDGLLVEGSLVLLGLGLQRPMKMRRDVLQGKCDASGGFHGQEKGNKTETVAQWIFPEG